MTDKEFSNLLTVLINNHTKQEKKPAPGKNVTLGDTPENLTQAQYTAWLNSLGLKVENSEKITALEQEDPDKLFLAFKNYLINIPKKRRRVALILELKKLPHWKTLKTQLDNAEAAGAETLPAVITSQYDENHPLRPLLGEFFALYLEITPPEIREFRSLRAEISKKPTQLRRNEISESINASTMSDEHKAELRKKLASTPLPDGKNRSSQTRLKDAARERQKRKDATEVRGKAKAGKELTEEEQQILEQDQKRKHDLNAYKKRNRTAAATTLNLLKNGKVDAQKLPQDKLNHVVQLLEIRAADRVGHQKAYRRKQVHKQKQQHQQPANCSGSDDSDAEVAIESEQKRRADNKHSPATAASTVGFHRRRRSSSGDSDAGNYKVLGKPPRKRA